MRLSLITLAAAAATSLPSTKFALSASASRMSPGSPTMKMLGLRGGADNQVKPDNDAWQGGSKQLITWKFKGAVPKVHIILCRVTLKIPLIFGLITFYRPVEFLEHSTKNTGSHVVTVPTGLVPGKYFLKVASRSDDRVDALSPTFTIDKSATPSEISDVALGGTVGGLPFR